MKRTLFGITALLFALPLGCQTQGSSSGELLFGNNNGSEYNAVASDSLGAGRHNTPNHFQDPNLGKNGLSDPTQIQVQVQNVGSPEAVRACTGARSSRMRRSARCSPRSASTSRTRRWGRRVSCTTTARPPSAWPSTRGAPPRPSSGPPRRSPSRPTSSSPRPREILANTTPIPSCPGTELLDSVGNFTADGISCVIGKPATQDYVALANQLITDAPDQTTGQQLALAALLEAAHTCE